MASEIQLAHGTSGATLYAVVRTFTGTVWRTTTSAFVAYNGANWADYDIAMTEQGTSAYYVGDFPAAIPAGVYAVEVRLRAGGSPATTDAVVGAGEVEWSGTAVAPRVESGRVKRVSAAGVVTYHPPNAGYGALYQDMGALYDAVQAAASGDVIYCDTGGTVFSLFSLVKDGVTIVFGAVDIACEDTAFLFNGGENFRVLGRARFTGSASPVIAAPPDSTIRGHFEFDRLAGGVGVRPIDIEGGQWVIRCTRIDGEVEVYFDTDTDGLLIEGATVTGPIDATANGESYVLLRDCVIDTRGLAVPSIAVTTDRLTLDRCVVYTEAGQDSFSALSARTVRTAGPINYDGTVSANVTLAPYYPANVIAGYLDTEIAAIKAKTDQLAFTNAGKVDASLQEAADIATAVCQKIAHILFRRTMANVEASSDGDTLDLSSLYGLIQMAQEASVSGSTMTVKRVDGSTTLGTKTLTATAGADPITGVS